MIIFKTLRFKNFLSTGNQFITIDLNDAKSTLIVGDNGTGKSTMLDALSFVLFGKPHRNINKPQLVNSINKKNCVVELEFDIGSSQYKVIRGIFPTKFEIWKNDHMINQSANSREYQKILEQNIIKLNHKSFHQIVVLGSSSFIPFMQLPSAHRRSVIEDLLDINVFSKMNIILKDKTGKLKEALKEITHKFEINETKIYGQKKLIRNLTILKESHREEKEAKIQEMQTQVQGLQDTNSKALAGIKGREDEVRSKLSSHQSKKQTLLHSKGQYNQEMKTIVREVKFYEVNDVCPTCTQEISNEVKTDKVNDAKADAKVLMASMEEANRIMEEVEDKLTSTSVTLKDITDTQNEINSNIQTISRLQGEISMLESDLLEMVDGGGDIKTANVDMEALQKIKEDLLQVRFEKTEEFTYNTIIGEMLKDTGIKTKVITQYLPVINKLVNQYLQTLDFFVHFDLDDSFHETIRSRHRDIFSYDSFSEGEKQRIDLALLFTWRMVAKMKNSVSTNLLVLDETFDSSLDHDGVENLTKILYTLPDETNVFVISHKGELLDGKFARKFTFYKHKNFSLIK